MTKQALWAAICAFLALMHGMHEHNKGRASWRDVLVLVVLGAVAGVILNDFMLAYPDAVPQDHFG